MPINITTTRTAGDNINCLVYGAAGMGKTVLCSTVPRPIIVSAERGLLSIAQFDIPVIEVHSVSDLTEAHSYLKTINGDYDTICIDSLSEIAETILAEQKLLFADGRQAYGKMNDLVAAFIRSFKALPYHTYFICKQGYLEDEKGVSKYMPSIPGKTMMNDLPYAFDLVMCMRIATVEDKDVRYLQTQPDIKYEAKDRSGILDKNEKPHLGQIFEKMKQESN